VSASWVGEGYDEASTSSRQTHWYMLVAIPSAEYCNICFRRTKQKPAVHVRQPVSLCMLCTRGDAGVHRVIQSAISEKFANASSGLLLSEVSRSYPFRPDQEILVMGAGQILSVSKSAPEANVVPVTKETVMKEIVIRTPFIRSITRRWFPAPVEATVDQITPAKSETVHNQQ